MNPIIEWSAEEHVHFEKTSEWFWSFGIIVATLAVISFIFSNLLLSILIVVSGFALGVAAHKRPKRLNYAITDRGIVVDNKLYTFLDLDHFWIDHSPVQTAGASPFAPQSHILVKSRKAIMPLIKIPIDDTEIHPEDVRDVLLKYLTETEIRESIFVKLLERIGI